MAAILQWRVSSSAKWRNEVNPREDLASLSSMRMSSWAQLRYGCLIHWHASNNFSFPLSKLGQGGCQKTSDRTSDIDDMGIDLPVQPSRLQTTLDDFPCFLQGNPDGCWNFPLSHHHDWRYLIEFHSDYYVPAWTSHCDVILLQSLRIWIYSLAEHQSDENHLRYLLNCLQ